MFVLCFEKKKLAHTRQQENKRQSLKTMPRLFWHAHDDTIAHCHATLFSAVCFPAEHMSKVFFFAACFPSLNTAKALIFAVCFWPCTTTLLFAVCFWPCTWQRIFVDDGLAAYSI
jgi:hypothetical protein